MFKRALAHQSNATPLRSSDKRKLVKDVLARYDFAPDTIGEDELRELGRMILPEGIRLSTIETSGGVEGSLYLSPENGAMWMAFGRNSKELVPTLNLLSLTLPQPPLPIIKLHHPLPPPLFTGAPLFIGAVRDLARPWRLPDVQEGEIVAFVTAPDGDQSDQVHYVGVGRLVAPGGMAGALERRVKALKSDGEGEDGRFCDILCIIGDHLWESGSKPVLKTFLLPPPRKPLAVAPAGTSAPPPSSVSEADDNVPDISTLSTSDRAGPSTSLSSSEISTLLNLALHQSLANLDNTIFPMPASTLYSAHVLPNRPSYIPRDQREDVVVGKSEWKKVSKWFKEVAKEGLVKIKDSKGEVTVVSFDPSHALIDGHKTHVTIAEQEAKEAKRAARDAAVDGTVDAKGKGKGRELAIEEFWKPAGHAVEFWEMCGIDKSTLHPSSTLKSTIETYILRHNLADPRNQRFILLDEPLADAVKARGIDKLSREEIISRLRAGVSWSISVGGQIRKGTLPPVTLSVKTRQGRKVVTIITGLEGFAINVDEFAEDMRRVCAGSASIQPLQGASPKLNLQEVLIQGNQVKPVTEALIARGVPKRYIKEGEGDKKKK